MTARPWVTPQEVREYSELPAVQSRGEARLAVDIARADYILVFYFILVAGLAILAGW